MFHKHDSLLVELEIDIVLVEQFFGELTEFVVVVKRGDVQAAEKISVRGTHNSKIRTVNSRKANLEARFRGVNFIVGVTSE